jgi:hypothetical protein
MRDCPNGEIRDVLPDFVHGRLMAAEAARVASHLAHCADCAAEVELLADAEALFRAPITVNTAAIAAAVASSTIRSAAVAHADQGRSLRLMRRAAVIGTVALGGVSLVAVQRAFFGRTDATPTIDSAVVATTPAVASAGAPSAAVAPSNATPSTRKPVALAFAGGITDVPDDDLATLESAIASLETSPPSETTTPRGAR